MLFQSFKPSPILQNLVKTYHVRHFEFPENTKIPVKLFPPRAEQYINFYIEGGETQYFKSSGKSTFIDQVSLVGQYTQLVNRRTTPKFLIVQVPFYPGALFKLTGIPFEELRDQSITLDCLYPVEIRRVNEQLKEAKSYAQMIRIIDEFLTQLYVRCNSRNHPFEKILPYLGHYQAVKRMDWLADQACLSVRQFERLSKNYFGVSPKTMARIARFSGTYIVRNKRKDCSWLDIAAMFDYEDYQHLVRDYKEFTSVTPNELWVADQRSPDKALGLT